MIIFPSKNNKARGFVWLSAIVHVSEENELNYV